MSRENNRRYVAGYSYITISDDYGKYMKIGDIVEIHVMPFDYKVRGELMFSEERCAFYIDSKYGKYELSHHEDCRDMGATIKVSKTFRRVKEVSNG